MTLHGLSDRFLAAVATDHDWAVKVQVWNGDFTLLADITENVTDGSQDTDETAEIRRTCSLTLEGTPAVIPSDLKDLLHPATGNELRIWRGVKYADGTDEFAPLGVFRLTKPVITDDGVTPTMTVSGHDRASVIAGISWQKPYPIMAGDSIAAVIQAAMESRYPGLKCNFTNVDFSFPDTTFGANMVVGSGGSSDPMSDLITFAATAGCELFFDPVGVATLRPIVNPLTSELIDGVSFVEGQTCTMTSASRTIDETNARNGVILYCNGTGGAKPFVVEVWDTDPGSPTYYKGNWGERPFVINTTAIPAGNDTIEQATAKAYKMAFGQLQLVLGTLDDVSLTTVPNPALREGDCTRVVRERLKIDNGYVISTMNVPLGPLNTMSVGFRPRLSVAL